ncbi:GNAT family N-acetyltransferase [Paenibacillus tarimensis]|uniref:GNAT family N-acetyltransferase n=1 Tax=Paenibacillus tarimensis TaxID=416012 RepID=UPI001F208E20|nr:GNAT family N-acetyltransferase [Paenibacillus tarimensis]MCF2943385.1 GNAT family N-acetyltransferase [Paenibacillus tarimensis]
MRIQELKSAEEIKQSYGVMNQLRTDLTEEQYLDLYGRMAGEGYRLMALFDEEDKLVSLAGFSILTNLYYYKHIWVYDLITDQAARSMGYGEKLLVHLEQLAKENGCYCIALSSGFPRKDAHRFYETRAGYSKESYVFKKVL